MWRLWAFLGSTVWLATIAASGSVNYLAGQELGRSPTEAQIFAILGLSADAWKAMGPIFLVSLWRSGKLATATLAASVWIVCFVFAVSAALGLAARNRGAVIGGHDAVRIEYQSLIRELEETEKRRLRLGEVGAPSEREAAVAAALAKPVPGGTVGSLSENCTKDQWRARPGCAEVAELRRDFAKATEGRELDGRLAALKGKLQALREQGALRDSDPQAHLISRLTLGGIAAGDVGLIVILLLVAMIELISAFAPLIVHEFVHAERSGRAVTAGGEKLQAAAVRLEEIGGLVGDTTDAPLRLTDKREGDVYEYLADRVRPDREGCARRCKSRPVERRRCAVAWRSKSRPLARLILFRFGGIGGDVCRGKIRGGSAICIR